MGARMAWGVMIFMMGASSLMADQFSFARMASFTSDTQNDVVLQFPSFDIQEGRRILDSVRVDFRHSSHVILRADNDDRFKSATANGRMIRNWFGAGPGVFEYQTYTIRTKTVELRPDDGDGSRFDATPPDGTDFGAVEYDKVARTFFPSPSLYDTDGPGTINFTIDVQLMVNDLQFIEEPDVWQLEVQDPKLDVEVILTYDFTVIPEPASLALLLAGGVGLSARRGRKVQL